MYLVSNKELQKCIQNTLSTSSFAIFKLYKINKVDDIIQ